MIQIIPTMELRYSQIYVIYLEISVIIGKNYVIISL
jgi:hypothetical protein